MTWHNYNDDSKSSQSQIAGLAAALSGGSAARSAPRPGRGFRTWAIETAADAGHGRGYCLGMICADFLAGAHLDNGNP